MQFLKKYPRPQLPKHCGCSTRLAETLLVRVDFLRHQLTKASSLKQEVGRQWFFSLENGGFIGDFMVV